jgi:hypothetical protein
MALPTRPFIAASYPKHRQATRRDWDSSKAKSLSLSDAPVVQYNPYTMPLAVIEATERAAIREENAITDLGDDTVKVHKFYLDCATHFGSPGFVAGYCDGVETPYILVRWDLSGRYHGQPASIAYLRAQGVRR